MSSIEFSVRGMQEKDCNYIADLCGQLGYPTISDEVKPRIKDILIRENHKVFVAETTNKKVIGWVHVHLYPLLECDLMAEIGGLIVDKQYRKSGIGKELMNNAEKWAKDNGCKMVSVRSNSIRKEAHAFYESVGYRKVKEQYTFRKEL